MKTVSKAIVICLLFMALSGWDLMAQKYTISGYVKDVKNGETLIGVNVAVKNTSSGVVTNPYGFYSLSLASGSYTLSISYLGFQTVDTMIMLNTNVTLNLELIEKSQVLKEVRVTSERPQDNVNSTKMSVVSLSGKTMKQIPVAFGEVDVLKVLSFLPGVKTSDEGSSAMSVRGGARDQNLILLDEATVYNASHLGNLLSVFNNDAIQNVEFYKGNIPAQYGGRLSSLIDIRMKDGNNKNFAGSGGIGTLSSRFTLEGPIVKNKGSFIISGRRAYIDLLTKAMHALNDSFPKVPYYFYDLNLKANYNINSKNRILLSGYLGKDVFDMTSDENDYSNNFKWGNYTSTLRWNYIPSDRVFTNLTLLVSNYNYNFGNSFIYGKEKKESKFNWDAYLIDYSLKYDWGFYVNENNTLRAGILTTYHDFNPGKITGHDDTVKYNFKMPVNNALEHGIYLSNEQKLTPDLTLNYGLRYTLYQNIGAATVYKLNSSYETIDTLYYGKRNIYNFYHSLEPRVVLTYVLAPYNSIKVGYNRTSQYVHVATNASTGSILDLWVGSGTNIKPQVADLFTAGYFRNFMDNTIEASVEVYYKHMQNQIEFREFAQPQFNPRMDEDFRFGKGRSYGLELMVRKPEGKLTGWIGYTLSRTELKINDIQEKGWFTSSFDRTHDLSVVAMYNLSKRVSLSANFCLKSGRPFTSPALRYNYMGAVVPYYPNRNNDRVPLYHRLDFSLTWRGKDKPGRRYHSERVFSLFDVYNRTNPVSIYFKPDDNHQNITNAYKQNFLGFMPSFTWNFNF
jgi:outer membrane cobalamin receptor